MTEDPVLGAPLRRQNVTAASRIMVPTYALLALFFAIVYFFDPGGRASRAPSLEAQRDIMALWKWGVVMGVLAFMKIVAIVVNHRLAFVYALSCGAIAWFFWGVAVCVSYTQNDAVTLMAPVLPWFVMVCHIATIRSLLVGEVSR